MMYKPTIEMVRELIDVTSNSRPDLNWIFVDANGHYHQWHEGETLASNYTPSKTYYVPSIEWIETGVEYYPDGSAYEVGFNRCKYCGEKVTPGYTADTYTQYIPGITRYYVDGKEVSWEELEEIIKSSEENK